MKQLIPLLLIGFGGMIGGFFWSFSGVPTILFSFCLLTLLYGAILNYVCDSEHALVFFISLYVIAAFLHNSALFFLTHAALSLFWYGIARRFLSSRAFSSYLGTLALLFVLLFLPSAFPAIHQNIALFLWSITAYALLAYSFYRFWRRRPSLIG